MHQPTGLLKIYVRQKKSAAAIPPQKLSKLVVGFFATAQLCFGFDFGFVYTINEKFKTPIRFLGLITGIVMTLLLAISFTFEGAGHDWMFIYILHYVPMFFMLWTAKYSTCEFLSDLLASNKQTKSGNDSKKAGLIAWLFFLIIFIVKLTSSVIYCSLTRCTTLQMTILNACIHLPIVGLDLIGAAHFVLFYLLNAHMKDMKMKLKDGVFNLEQIQSKYKTVADDFARFRTHHDRIFIWKFITRTPEWMVIIWNHLYSMKSSKELLLHTCTYIWALNVTLQICLPALLAEMTNVQTEKMKMILQDRLLMETDDKNTQKLVRLLRYIDARPLLDKAWRLLPLDLELPVSMLSLCTTYLIVIIQFTHLYD